jgi:mRNA interferase MazF
VSPGRVEIWWVALDPALGSEIAKTRPYVVRSRDIVNQHRRTVVVVPLSTASSAHPPILVAVSWGGKPAVAVVDQIRAIAKQRLRSRIGLLSEPEMEAICEALRQILNFA